MSEEYLVRCAPDAGKTRRHGRRRNYVALVSFDRPAAYFVLVALIGPLISPYDPNALGVGPPSRSTVVRTLVRH